MKLTYRGVSYDCTPNPAPQPGAALDTGHYRGAPVTFRTLAAQPAQPAHDLTWRGVAYRTGTATPATIPVVASAGAATAAPALASAAVDATPASIPDLARHLFIRRHQRSRRREQGMMVRLAAEVGLPLEDAAHYESHIQGKMPHDFAAYDRSSTAMS